MTGASRKGAQNAGIEVGFGQVEPLHQESLESIQSPSPQERLDALEHVMEAYHLDGSYRDSLDMLAGRDVQPEQGQQPSAHSDAAERLQLLEQQERYSAALKKFAAIAKHSESEQEVAFQEEGTPRLGGVSKAAAQRLAEVAVILNRAGETELSRWLVAEIQQQTNAPADHPVDAPSLSLKAKGERYS